MAILPKLLVTGGSGFVAGSVLAQAGGNWVVHALSRRALPARPADVQWHISEQLGEESLARLFDLIAPDVVIHTAALADIDFCQANPGAARETNVELTRTVSRLCLSHGARLVFCSTDTVFDGEHAPYQEQDAVGPVNLYAQTKVEAEGIVSELGALATIARLALVVGLAIHGAGNSFLARMLASFKAGRSVAVPAHEIRTPVDVVTAGRGLLELARDRHEGIFHLAGHERINRFDMAQRIARRFGFTDNLVVAQSSAGPPGRAPRPRDVSLANAKACANLKTPMLSFDDALTLILAAAAGRVQ